MHIKASNQEANINSIWCRVSVTDFPCDTAGNYYSIPLTKVSKPPGNKLTVGHVSQFFCSWLLPLHKNIISHIKCYLQNTSVEDNFFHFSCSRAAKTYCIRPFLATETFPQGWHFPAISTVAPVWRILVSR